MQGEGAVTALDQWRTRGRLACEADVVIERFLIESRATTR